MTNKEAIREDYEKYRGETQSRNESVFNALSGLKRIVLGSVFERHFEAATAEDAETDWERLSAYKNEAVYVRSRQQSVRVIYQIQVLPEITCKSSSQGTIHVGRCLHGHILVFELTFFF